MQQNRGSIKLVFPSINQTSNIDKNKAVQIVQRNQRPMSLVFLEKQNTLLLLSQTYNLLFAVLCTGDEVNGFHVSKVDIPSEDVHV